MTECRYPNNHMSVAFRAKDRRCVSAGHSISNDLTLRNLLSVNASDDLPSSLRAHGRVLKIEEEKVKADVGREPGDIAV